MSIVGDTWVIWYREMLRYKRNKYYLLGQILFPLLFIVLIGFGFNELIKLPDQDMNYVDFLSSGILVFMVASGALGGGFNLIEERKSGFLKNVIVAPVSRTSIILGKIAARISFSIVQVGLFILILSLFLDFGNAQLELTLLTLMIIAALFVCFGVVLASFLLDLDKYRMVSGLIMLPIYFLSGVFFPITALPLPLEALARINPLTYAVDLFRYSLLGVNELPLLWDAVLLIALTLVLFMLATVSFDRKFRE